MNMEKNALVKYTFFKIALKRIWDLRQGNRSRKG